MKSFTFAAMDTRTEINRLNTLKQNYTIWANGKGLSKSNFFSPIMKEKKNQLIDQYKKEFYDTLKIKRQEQDHAWIRENVDVKEYEKHLKVKLEDKNIAGVSSTLRSIAGDLEKYTPAQIKLLKDSLKSSIIEFNTLVKNAKMKGGGLVAPKVDKMKGTKDYL